MKSLVLLSFLCIQQVLFAQSISRNVFSNDFENFWVIEKVSPETSINSNDSVLEVIASNGVTLWYTQLLEAPVSLSFEAQVVDEGGEFDRVSDLNCFWMANDPNNPEDFFARSKWRNGVFGNYYSLSMYYLGYGGNNNSTTRFRKYHGNFEEFKSKQVRPEIITEYTDSTHLITPNTWYFIEIEVKDNRVLYSMNGKTIIDYTDTVPYVKGYFGLRTVKNHILYKNFRINRLN